MFEAHAAARPLPEGVQGAEAVRVQDWRARCRAADDLQAEDVGEAVAEWLVTQRAAWQAGQLDLEQRLLLQMAGIRSRVSY